MPGCLQKEAHFCGSEAGQAEDGINILAKQISSMCCSCSQTDLQSRDVWARIWKLIIHMFPQIPSEENVEKQS